MARRSLRDDIDAYNLALAEVYRVAYAYSTLLAMEGLPIDWPAPVPYEDNDPE